MTVKVWNVPASVGQLTPCNYALNWFVHKHCKHQSSAHTLQLLSYPANIIDTVIRMFVWPIFAALLPFQTLYAAHCNQQPKLFKTIICLSLPTFIFHVAQTLIYEAYYAGTLLVHLTGISALWSMINGYDIAEGYFKEREEASQPQEFDLVVLDFFPKKPKTDLSAPGVPALNVKASVTEFTPLTHMLNKYALERVQGTWKAHAIQLLAYPASLVDTIIRMAVLPVFEILAPFYDIYNFGQKGNYGRMAEAALLLPLTFFCNVLTTVLYELRYACTLAVHLSGITTLSALFLGDERAQSYFKRRENILLCSGKYGTIGEGVQTIAIELATLRSNFADFAHKMLKRLCSEDWKNKQTAAGWQVVEQQEEGDELYFKSRAVLDPLPTLMRPAARRVESVI